MDSIYRYPTSIDMMRKTWGGTANEITEDIKRPLRGDPFSVSYRRDPKFFGRSTTTRKVRWY